MIVIINCYYNVVVFSLPDISGSLPLLPLPQAESTLLEDEPVQRDDEAMDLDEDAVPEPSHIETSAANVSEPMDDEPSFQPEDSLEESLPAPAPCTESVVEDPVTWTIVENSSRQRHPKLTTSTGYSYNVKRRNANGTIDWQCCRRKKGVIMCRATVKQVGEAFIPGRWHHCHPAEPGTTAVHQIRAAVVERAMNNLFQPAGKIVNQVLREKLDVAAPHPSLPKPAHLARTANRHRQSARPAEPMDLNFDIDTDYVGTDFLQSDIRVGDRQHIVCGTQDMLGLLGQCKTWYVDSTFKVVKSPFTQLFSIHGFIRSGNCIKQVPMVFVIMSGKSKKDYRKVFQAILDLLSDSKSETTGDGLRICHVARRWQGLPWSFRPRMRLPLVAGSVPATEGWHKGSLHEGWGHTRIRQEASGPALSTRRGDPRRIHRTDRAAATLPRTSIACWLCQKQLDRHHPLPSQQMVGLQLRSSHQQWPGGLSPQAKLRCRKTQPAFLPPDRLIEGRMPGRLHHNAPHLQPQDEEDTAEAISFVAKQSHQSVEIIWKWTAHWQAATSVLCSSHSLLIDAGCSVQWIFCDTNV